MKSKQKSIISLWAVFLFVVGIVLFALIVQQVQSQEGGPSAPATDVSTIFPPERTATPDPGQLGLPFPVNASTGLSDNTATPDRTQLAECCLTSYPTEMPRIISAIIDLSPELTEYDEYWVFVQAENGEFVVYTIGPVISGWRDGIPQSIIDLLPLSPTDVFIDGSAPSPWRGTLGEILGELPTPIPTLNPYP